MNIVVLPSATEIKIIVNPVVEITREGKPRYFMPWMYAPWPELQYKGTIQIEIESGTLRDLLLKLSELYKKAGVNFSPVDDVNSDVDFDYDVFVDDKNYVGLPGNLDYVLNTGEEVTIRMLWRWDG